MFRLRPVELGFFDTAAIRHTFTAELAASPEQVWDALTEPRPLSWCRGLQARYVSPAPYGPGTIRSVSMRGIRLRENYLLWQEAERRQAFYVEAAKLPLFGAFAEDCRVTPTEAGSTLVWRFAVQPARYVWAAPLRPVLRRSFSGLVDDTITHFGRVGRVGR